MGNLQNKLTSFKEAKNYQEFEGILFGAVLWVSIFLFAATSCLFILRNVCQRGQTVYDLFCPANCDCCTVIQSILAYIFGFVIIAIATSPPITPVCSIVFLICFFVILAIRSKKIRTNCKLLKPSIHSALAALFPDLITKKTHTQKDFKYTERAQEGGFQEILIDHETPVDEQTPEHRHVTIPMEDTEEKQVFLFGDKEFHYKYTTIPCCNCLPFYLLHGYTYFYFISVVVVAIHWFMVMVIENAVYRKTTTCNDINVEDNSFNCFNITHEFNPTLIDCTEPRNQNIKVFCYLYQPNLGALAIAFSTFKLLLFGVTVYFKIAIKLAEHKCFRWFMGILQVILTILSILLPIALPPIHFKTTFDVYFFHGNAVIRWVMYGLIPLTAVLVILVPWCGFTHKTAFRSMALENQETQANVAVEEPQDHAPQGDAAVKQRQGDVEVKQPQDDAAVKQRQGDVEVKQPQDDAAVKQRQGDVEVKQPQDDAAVKQRQGDVEFKQPQDDAADEQKGDLLQILSPP